MSVNDDVLQASSESFWEVGKYMRTVKRCDNGYKLCDHLRQFIETRSEIEKKYASMLSAWSKKWSEFLEKGPEYGTGQAAWYGVLQEADEVSSLHTDMAERLMTEVYASIKAWQKENYHKSLMHFKESKDFEDSFRKAQKPWGKLLGKVMAARKDYHTACRTEKSTANQENNAKGDSTVSQDSVRKLQEKLEKCRLEVQATREKYEACLNDLNGYNARYIEDMTEVYKKCQDFERKRIEFFKKTFFEIHRCLDLSVDPRYAQVYTNLHGTVARTEPDQDLKWWSTSHGVDMPMAWPAFEEYSPELQAISRRGKGQVSAGEGGITITSIRHSREDSLGSFTSETNQPPTYSSVSQRNSVAVTGASSSTRAAASSSVPASYGRNGDNPFGETDEGDEEGFDLDDNSNGWAVRALYDYDKAEEDEIGFKAGDVFVQLTNEDEMGWCKGRKDGVVGLFPSNYVERI
ncbi:protein kinase C and casein kinase substrate in neurons protein 1-like isoform X2 [Pomacea canaliculata]|uniref:protein kinase C and casein kinase substrate in neurons protein 1-like isoform X2 n=1 Tax=Pomacea canaliculata TaxID=400727 RepID=UPI000D73AAAA|nr:protein kinase C and casein kinase substrate in neurons protein 1-like isoform X2 [Pomacea canaliculata]